MSDLVRPAFRELGSRAFDHLRSVAARTFALETSVSLAWLLLACSHLVVRERSHLNALGVASLLFAVVLWSLRRRLSPEVFRALFVGCGFLILLPVWNGLLTAYQDETGFKRDIFRVRRLQWPLYGQPSGFDNRSLLAGVAAAGLCTVAFLKPIRVSLVVFFHLLLVVAFALTEGSNRLFNDVVHLKVFSEAAELFPDSRTLLAGFVERMPTLSFRVGHYPPGLVWLEVAGRELGAPWLLKFLCLVGAPLTTLWVALTARELGLRSGLAAVLIASSAGMSIFASTSPSALEACLSAAALHALVRGLLRRQPAWIALFALLLAALTMLSFVVFVVGLALVLLAVFWAFFQAARWRVTLGYGALAGAFYVLFFLLMWAVSGFDIVQCFRNSLSNNVEGMSSPFDDPWRWMFRSTGNLLAYAYSVGPALWALVTMVSWRRAGPVVRGLLAGAVALMLLVSFGGLFYLETERIWLVFSPLVALVAASVVGGDGDGEGDVSGPLRLVPLALAFSWCYEVLFRAWM